MKTLKGRTVTVKNRSHWDKLLKATLDGKLLIVHYSAVSGTGSGWAGCFSPLSLLYTLQLCTAFTRDSAVYGMYFHFRAVCSPTLYEPGSDTSACGKLKAS